MARTLPNKSPLIARYLTAALAIASPGVYFSARALSMHLFRMRQWKIGFELLDVPHSLDMPIDTYIRWMLVFSTPFLVIAGFVLYRLAIRLKLAKADADDFNKRC
ncbi:hypothetical protein CA13_00610 [Planctomycetes bacterium CA13]|uniref:Uncharacterized protein n=1 Tax=Novipirellula herctigrandis TaxID=2527986 RepID=A0A5C5YUM7_9BACT|nr:hypothetical protein CA13_00610 [Planctomycetes bacterium CA13]